MKTIRKRQRPRRAVLPVSQGRFEQSLKQSARDARYDGTLAIVALAAIVGIVALAAMFFGRDFRGGIKLDRMQVEMATTK